MKRYALSSFPVFMEAAELAARPWLYWAIVGVGWVLQLFLIYNYVNWGFQQP